MKQAYLFYFLLTLMTNLCSMENTINDEINGLRYIEMLVLYILSIPHTNIHDHTIFAFCRLSLVNKKLLNIWYQTIEQRKQYIQTKLNVIKTPFNFITYHPFGTACAFLTITDKSLKKSGKMDLNLCRVQLNDNQSISIYSYRIMGIFANSLRIIKPYKDKPEFIVAHGYRKSHHWWYPIKLDFPTFDKNNTAYITAYSLSYQYKENGFRKKSFFIDKNGILTQDHIYQSNMVLNKDGTLKIIAKYRYA